MWEVNISKFTLPEKLDHRLVIEITMKESDSSSESSSSESSEDILETPNIFLLENGDFIRVCSVPDIQTFPETPLAGCDYIRTNKIDLIFRSSTVMNETLTDIIADIKLLKRMILLSRNLGL